RRCSLHADGKLCAADSGSMKTLPSSVQMISQMQRRTQLRDGILLAAVFALLPATPALCQAEPVAVLPEGVKPVWQMDKAYRETTPSREKICLNGLWRWQPAQTSADMVPQKNWGYFKVPGCWPGMTDYMSKDFQTVHAHPSWKNERLGTATAAWYERTFSVPREWTGRRVTLAVEYLNS